MGRDIYKKEKEMNYKCRCGGEWYPPGFPRMIEGIREAVSRTGQVKIFENLKINREV